MKKNKMMRVASALLVAVLMTTSVISGTFAKYVTTESASDSARVAKWGVELTVTGGSELFSDEYTGTNSAITVKTQDTNDLVAPGTSNTTGVSFSIKGTPEVATKVTAKLNTAKDVFLKYSNNGEEAYYYPVVFTLVHTYRNGAFSIASAANGTGATVTATDGTDTIVGTMAQIAKVLENLTNGMKQVNPGYIYDDTFTLTWAWDFEEGENDSLDTELGNIAAGSGTDSKTKDVDYCLSVSYDFSITVEQVD